MKPLYLFIAFALLAAIMSFIPADHESGPWEANNGGPHIHYLRPDLIGEEENS